MSRFLWRQGPYNHTVICLTKKLTCTWEFVADIVDQGKYKLHDIFWGHLTMIQLYTSAWSEHINKLISSISALLHTKYRIHCTIYLVRVPNKVSKSLCGSSMLILCCRSSRMTVTLWIWLSVSFSSSFSCCCDLNGKTKKGSKIKYKGYNSRTGK